MDYVVKNCAPGRQFGLSFSCFSISEWSTIKDLLKKKDIKDCKGDELCLFEKLSKNSLINSKTKYKIFKPDYQIPNLGISNFDINKILNPYSDIFKNYKHIGTYPSDVHKIIDFKSTLMNKFSKNLNNFSIVLNTDVYEGPGLHWVVVFVNSKNSTIEYFDSLGQNPNKNIQQILNFIKKIFDNYYDSKFKIHYNNIIHQKGNSECGIYCIYYVIARLFNYSIDDINNNIKDYNSISEFRKLVFRLK
jgi:hypothetical protein